jgi:uncharacterized protein
MILRLSEIDNEVRVRGELGAEKLPRSESGEYRFATPVTYDVTVKKVEGGARVLGSLDCILAVVCSRCLEEFSFPVAAQLDIELEPKSLMPEANELELSKNEMDVDYFEGDEIDLTSLFHEEILLNIPMMPLCREDCLGLCGICGKNKNSEECRCAEAPGTVLGEKLKSFLNRTKGD